MMLGLTGHLLMVREYVRYLAHVSDLQRRARADRRKDASTQPRANINERNPCQHREVLLHNWRESFCCQKRPTD